MSSMISAYEGEKRSYQTQIDSLRTEESKYIKLYESLRVFKGKVEAAQINFNEINNFKFNMLQELSQVEKNSVAAKKYHENMNNTLEKTGKNVVSSAYTGLMRLISRKIKIYSSEISRCNAEIRSYTTKINSLDGRIRELQRAEEK